MWMPPGNSSARRVYARVSAIGGRFGRQVKRFDVAASLRRDCPGDAHQHRGDEHERNNPTFCKQHDLLLQNGYCNVSIRRNSTETILNRSYESAKATFQLLITSKILIR